MTSEMIEKFIASKGRNGNAVNIHFKERSTVCGMFIIGKDFNELKSKNFWRIVSSTYMEEWKKTSNMELARIYNGNVFTRLTD
ncbi:MAG: short-chain dehydrogenase [Ferruginibacter sp.]